MQKTLLLTGATGFIGSFLANHFAAKGWNVIALIRTVPQKTVEGVRFIQHDLETASSFELPESADLFVHAGYIKQEKGKDAFALNLRAAEVLLNATTTVPNRIFLSSLSADENALSVYGRQKAAIEKRFLENNGTVIRAGLVIGDGGLFASMRTYLEKRKLIPLFGKGNQPVQSVFVSELATAIEKIAETNSKGRFVVATDRPVPYREFYKRLCAHLEVRPRFLRIPFWLAGMLISVAGFFGIKLPVTKDNLLGLKQMKRIPSAADLEKLEIKLRDF